MHVCTVLSIPANNDDQLRHPRKTNHHLTSDHQAIHPSISSLTNEQLNPNYSASHPAIPQMTSNLYRVLFQYSVHDQLISKIAGLLIPLFHFSPALSIHPSIAKSKQHQSTPPNTTQLHSSTNQKITLFLFVCREWTFAFATNRKLATSTRCGTVPGMDTLSLFTCTVHKYIHKYTHICMCCASLCVRSTSSSKSRHRTFPYR